MNIGYLKFTMNMELDFTNAKIGNIEGRATLFKAIIDSGWNLTLYSQVTKHDEELIYGKKDIKNEYGIDNRWIKSIDYLPDKLVKPNTDLLIIENGPDNLLFKTRYDGIPFIRRCAEVLNSYSGLVFILNIHPDVPFPLAKMAYCDVQYSDPKNCYRINRGSSPEHGWASYDEICKDKTLIFFNQAHNQRKYLDHFDRKRQGYGPYGVKFHRLPILYGRWLIPKTIRGNIRHNPPFDFVYLGYPRYREKEFRKFVYALQPHTVHTWGPWYKKSNAKFMMETDEQKNIVIIDFLEAQVLCTYKYHDAYASLSLISQKLQECGWVTHRTLETIHSGCILFGIAGAEGITDYLDEKYLVSSGEELKHNITIIRNMPYSKRQAVWEEQFEKIKKYDGFYMLRHLMKVYRREK